MYIEALCNACIATKHVHEKQPNCFHTKYILHIVAICLLCGRCNGNGLIDSIQDKLTRVPNERLVRFVAWWSNAPFLVEPIAHALFRLYVVDTLCVKLIVNHCTNSTFEVRLSNIAAARTASVAAPSKRPCRPFADIEPQCRPTVHARLHRLHRFGLLNLGK